MQNSPDTIISSGNLVEGKVEGSGIIQVMGTIRGDVILEGTLLVDAGGLVDGSIEADHVLVVGSIQGRVHAREILEITATAELSGTYTTHRLIVEQGAKINASVTMTEDNQGLPSGQHATTAQAPERSRPLSSPSQSVFDRATETASVPPSPAFTRTQAPAPTASTPTQPPVQARAAVAAPSPTPTARTTPNFHSVADSVESTSAILERAQAALASATLGTTTAPAQKDSSPEPPPIPANPAPPLPQEEASVQEASVSASVEPATENSNKGESNESAAPAPVNVKAQAKKKRAAENKDNLTSEPPSAASLSSATPAESMPLVFSEMLDEPEGDAHAGA